MREEESGWQEAYEGTGGGKGRNGWREGAEGNGGERKEGRGREKGKEEGKGKEEREECYGMYGRGGKEERREDWNNTHGAIDQIDRVLERRVVGFVHVSADRLHARPLIALVEVRIIRVRRDKPLHNLAMGGAWSRGRRCHCLVRYTFFRLLN